MSPVCSFFCPKHCLAGRVPDSELLMMLLTRSQKGFAMDDEHAFQGEYLAQPSQSIRVETALGGIKSHGLCWA